MLLIILIIILIRKRRDKLGLIRKFIAEGKVAISQKDYLKSKGIYELIRAVYDDLKDFEKMTIQTEIRGYYQMMKEEIEKFRVQQEIIGERSLNPSFVEVKSGVKKEGLENTKSESYNRVFRKRRKTNE